MDSGFVLSEDSNLSHGTIIDNKTKKLSAGVRLGLVTEVGNRKFTFGFLAKDRAGVVMGGENSFLYNSDKNNLLCH